SSRDSSASFAGSTGTTGSRPTRRTRRCSTCCPSTGARGSSRVEDPGCTEDAAAGVLPGVFSGEAVSRQSIGMDAATLAEITGGRWTVLPPASWRYGGLCFSAFDHANGQLVLLRTAQMEYGVPLERLNARLARGGLL